MKLNSSVIKSCTYNQARKQLTLRLHNGRKYKYDRVSEYEYAEFLLANSKGSWYNKYLRGTEA